MISICKKFHFDSAHKLPNYDGKCANLHGHRWFLDVEITGDVRKDTGMLMDFGELSKIVNETIINKVDHQYLNNLYHNPTAEVMVMYMAVDLQTSLQMYSDIKLTKLRLYETPEAYAEWTL